MMLKQNQDSKLKVLALVKDRWCEINISGLTPVGGSQSTGQSLVGLNHTGDYAILAQVGNALSVHRLRSSLRTPKPKPVSLQVGEVLQIDDLTLLVQEATSANTKSKVNQGDADLNQLSRLLNGMGQKANTQQLLVEILQTITQLCDHQYGLIISQELKGSYEVLAAQNLEASQAWLSEGLIQQALKKQEPIILQNVIGSGFDTRQSLMATKFMSVFCWPLVVQGITLGALVTGSQFPFSANFNDLKNRLTVYVSLAAVVLEFHLRELRLKQEVYELNRLQQVDYDLPFLTESAELNQVANLAAKIANSDLAVLIQGETGVGKEVLSRWIHEHSDRKAKPFIAVNCAAIPSELLESTLFGHKRGAFTGAIAEHIGKIQQAQGGTLFLDEIGDLPLSLQSKLLRVLQDKMVEPVGSHQPVAVDIRLICATHKNIGQFIQDSSNQTFRADLYYRIAQVTLLIPPLRERIGDIRLLAQKFLKEVNSAKKINSEGWNWLLTQSWPGNIRELKTAIKRAAILAEGETIGARDFYSGSGSAQLNPISESLNENQRWLGASNLETAKQAFVLKKIEQALQITNGNRTRAAEILGVTSRTLFRYLETSEDKKPKHLT